jgi:hypothetical protein
MDGVGVKKVKRPTGVGSAPSVGGPPAKAGQSPLEIRNAIQWRLAEISSAVDGEGEQKILAWINRYAAPFGQLWEGNAELRNALIERWDSNPAWCLAEIRRAWRGRAP